MQTKTDNKNNFFAINIEIDEDARTARYQENISDKVDLILDSMGVNGDPYKFVKDDNSRIIHLFRTDQRKRRGQLSRYCERYLKDAGVNFKAHALTKNSLEEQLVRLNREGDFQQISKQVPFGGYKGTDLKQFQDIAGWYEWQKDLYNMLFDEHGTMKKPHPRHIINLCDLTGNTGKSSFFKFLYWKNHGNIGRITYGTASQLRASIVKMGPRKCYIIDLTRAKGMNDSEQDLLSLVEDIKNGICIDVMRGAGTEILMDPPHVIISCNYLFDFELLSSDRWQVYEIKNKKLGPVNSLLGKRGKKIRDALIIKEYRQKLKWKKLLKEAAYNVPKK